VVTPCESGLLGLRPSDLRAPRARDALRLGTALDRGLTEKGVLQLLLDVRFLRNALAGGRPAPPDAGPAGGAAPPAQGDGAALAQRKRAFADLEASLQARARTSGCRGRPDRHGAELVWTRCALAGRTSAYVSHRVSLILIPSHPLATLPASEEACAQKGPQHSAVYEAVINPNPYAGRRQERLDPIDWATYEPYLWANEAAFCRRSAVLFGALTRLSASPPQARPRPSPPCFRGCIVCMQRVAHAKVALRLGTPADSSRICWVLGA